MLLISLALAWPTIWTPIPRDGADLEDEANDQVNSDEHVDIVGDASFPAGYWSLDDENLYFRIRVNEGPWNQEGVSLQEGSWGIALELDGDPSNLEYVIGMAGTLPTIEFLQHGTGSGPSATLTGYFDYSYTPLDDNLLLIEKADSSIDGDPDWFIDLAVARVDAETRFGIEDTTSFQVAIVTGQDNGMSTFDADQAGLLGMGNIGWSDALAIDEDGDGLSGPEEAEAGTDPKDADSDDDGLNDSRELDINTDPLLCDTDGDGLPDGLERGVDFPGPDTDTSAGCYIEDADPETKTHAKKIDTDDGSVLDGDEDINSNGRVDAWELDPNVGEDDVDADLDGVLNGVEAWCELDGGVVDDGDGGGDSDADGVDDAIEGTLDQDGDGIPSFCDEDSDGDGLSDVEEGTGDNDGDGTPDYLDDTDDALCEEDEEPDTGELLAGDFTGGHFTGGACSSAGGAGALFPALLSLFSLLGLR
ncbi:MAG TPA: hypothetical protein QGF58_22800, partial [Myxococcota bacterium]|nr:hypothetical protein [Myxococcota bacterium]